MPDITREEFDRLREQVERNTERLAAGDTTLAVLNTRLQQIDDKLDELSAGVKALQEKPAKRWESVSDAVIKWIVAALLGFIAVKVGLA